jgi:hypothetical protein
MRSGRGTHTGNGTRRDGLRSRSGVRPVMALIVVLGVLSWAVIPAFPLPTSLGSDTGSQVCRMACAGTSHCCCVPTQPAQKTARGSSPESELSSLATIESCPRDCATLTVVPGTTTARSAAGIHRLTAPGAGQMHYGADLRAAVQQELYDVARPRGPPIEARNDRSIARAPSDTPSAFASLRGEFPGTTRVDSDSSESRHPSAWHSNQQSVKRPHPAAKRSLSGVDAHHHEGDP